MARLNKNCKILHSIYKSYYINFTSTSIKIMIKIDYTSNINLATKNSVAVTNWLPDNDPRRIFLTVGGGLNMKGSCNNSSCISASYNLQNNIWLMKGYGIFNMSFIKYKNICPGCRTKMDPASFKEIGYRNA